MIKFEWDKRKNTKNIKKHGVSFEESVEAFFDEQGIVINDPDHSENEERFILLGYTSKAKLLVVCHCYRQNESIIRIISARKANKKEICEYYGADEL